MPLRPKHRKPRAPFTWLTGVAYYAKGIYRYINDHPIYLLSAGIAFNVLLCAVPLLFLLTHFLGQIIDWQSLMPVIDHQLEQIIPDQSTRATIMDTLRGQVYTILNSGKLAGIAGVVGALWTASTLFSSLRTALNMIYGLQGEKFFAVYKFYDMLLLCLFGVLVLNGTLTTPLLGFVHQIGASYIPRAVESVLEYFAGVVISTASILALFLLLYKYLSHQPVPFRSALIGAVTATVFWMCAKVAFGFYLTEFPTLGVLYGAYTFLVVSALWMYYVALTFIIGGILTKLHWERMRNEE